MVRRVADVVPVKSYGGEARVIAEKLGPRDGGRRQRRTGWNLAVVGMGYLLRELRTQAQLVNRKLIQVDVGHSQPCQLRTQIACLQTPVLSERFLKAHVPLLGVAAAVVSLHAKNALSQAGIRSRTLRNYCRTLRED